MDDASQRILEHLVDAGAVLTDSHFVYASGLHGTAYVNMRAVAHEPWWLSEVSACMTPMMMDVGVDLVLGPETLGRTLAGFAARCLGSSGIWCSIVGKGQVRRAVFSPNLDFGRLVPGKRVAIIDDLLTTGSSIRMAADLVRENGGTPVIAVAVVRRTPDVTADDCGVPHLKVLADIPDFTTFSPEECQAHGPCSRHVPVTLRPGHGHEWITAHPGYPTM